MMNYSRYCVFLFPALLLACAAPAAIAGERVNELFVSWGTGAQPDSSQDNTQRSLDYNFYLFQRSPRSGITLGAGYTRLTTDAASNTSIDAFSIYPQLTLWPVSPRLAGAYFFVRALGPSYLSDNWLGEREQANHFAFQSQVGVGYRHKGANEAGTFMLQVSWKHFSNANLFNANDSMDVPFVLAVGFSF